MRAFTILGLLLLSLTAAADIVYFENDLSIECDVIRVNEEEITVRVEKGTFTFPKSRISSIEYDYEKTMAKIQREEGLDERSANRLAVGR